MQTPVNYYVWYRIRGDSLQARLAVEAMMLDISRSTHIEGRLFVRRGEPSTWMEIYENVVAPATFERELAAAVLRHDLARFVAVSERHAEAFVAA